MAARTSTGNSLNRQLTQLAKLYGIQTSYVDMDKRRQEAHPESVLLALRALGADIRSIDGAHAALAEKQADVRQRTFEPVIVAWEGRLPKQRRLPAGAKATLVLEDGTTEPWPPRSPLAQGYHRLYISGTRTSESLIISAPVRAYFPVSERIAGVFAPLYALHSDRSPDAGDLTELGNLVDWTADRGGRVVSTLPLLATFLDEPFEPSPYSPISRLFWNEFYADVTRRGESESFPTSQQSLVDYKSTMKKRRLLLESSCALFADAPGQRRDEFEKFLADNPEAMTYAVFRARTEMLRGGWHDWPAQIPMTRHKLEQYHAYAQWVVQTQLGELESHSRKRDCLLYLDLPLGLHREGFDAWRYPDLFVKGVSGGAPPDPVFTTGQDWSFQPIHPEKMRADGYRYAIAYIRNHLRYAKLLRIDHVMGLHRLYWIPEGLKGDRGLYVTYPAEEMYAILSLESHRAGAGIVGENLGMVPPAVNRSMRRHNVRELYVAQYETAVSSRKAALRNPPAGSVASLNTHDLFPFRGFLEGRDIDARLRLGFINDKIASRERRQRSRVRKAFEKEFGKNVLEGCMKFLEKSKASIVLHNLEDLWGETRAQNIPATTREHANWRRRMRYSMERMRRMKITLER